MSESSPAACRFAIRDKTAFGALLGGLLNIDLALTLIRFACRDDADGFFFVMFILQAINVDNQQQSACRHSYGVPPLFARRGVKIRLIPGELGVEIEWDLESWV